MMTRSRTAQFKLCVIQGADGLNAEPREGVELVVLLANPGNWKRLSRASVNLRSGLPSWSVPSRRLEQFLSAAVARAKARWCHGRQAAAERHGASTTCTPNTPMCVADAALTACPKCQAAFPATSQTPQQIYERVNAFQVDEM